MFHRTERRLLFREFACASLHVTRTICLIDMGTLVEAIVEIIRERESKEDDYTYYNVFTSDIESLVRSQENCERNDERKKRKIKGSRFH